MLYRFRFTPVNAAGVVICDLPAAAKIDHSDDGWHVSGIFLNEAELDDGDDLTSVVVDFFCAHHANEVDASWPVNSCS